MILSHQQEWMVEFFSEILFLLELICYKWLVMLDVQLLCKSYFFLKLGGCHTDFLDTTKISSSDELFRLIDNTLLLAKRIRNSLRNNPFLQQLLIALFIVSMFFH